MDVFVFLHIKEFAIVLHISASLKMILLHQSIHFFLEMSHFGAYSIIINDKLLSNNGLQIAHMILLFHSKFIGFHFQ